MIPIELGEVPDAVDCHGAAVVAACPKDDEVRKESVICGWIRPLRVGRRARPEGCAPTPGEPCGSTRSLDVQPGTLDREPGVRSTPTRPRPTRPSRIGVAFPCGSD